MLGEILTITIIVDFSTALKELNISRNEFEFHTGLFDALSKGKQLEKVYMKKVGLKQPFLPRRGLFDEPESAEQNDEQVCEQSYRFGY